MNPGATTGSNSTRNFLAKARKRPKSLAALLAIFAAFAFVPACRPVITYMGYPDVDFQSTTASETAPGVTLAEGASADGTKALRMSSWSQESEGRGKVGRLWVQCVGATLEVLVVTESTFRSNERCMRLDATIDEPGQTPVPGGEGGASPETQPGPRHHETRACVSHYSPRVLSVENPVAFVDFLGNAGEARIVLAGDEERQLSLTFGPFTDPAFMERVWEECPRDWQPEIGGSPFEGQEEGDNAGPTEAGSRDAGSQDASSGDADEVAIPANARRVDTNAEPTAFPKAATPAPAKEAELAKSPRPAVNAAEASDAAKPSGAPTLARAADASDAASPASSDGEIEERMRRLEETARAASEL